MTTESVKLDRAIVNRLRRFSKRTGIPISRLANRMLAAALKNPNRVAVILALDDPKTRCAGSPRCDCGAAGAARRARRAGE